MKGLIQMANMNVTEEQHHLTETLAEVSKAYYNTGTSSMSDRDYDRQYDRLLVLEQMSGVVLQGSPTHVVGAQVLPGLKTVQHRVPALSLQKTKAVTDVAQFLGKQIGCLSLKMDGLTLIAEYDSNGRLYRLATRGDGFKGNDVTHAAPYIKGLPQVLPVKRALLVRGECYITYADYDVLNKRNIETGGKGYSNPRNLAAGSLALLDTAIIAKRRLRFMLFECVDGFTERTYTERFDVAKAMGFDVVAHTQVNAENVANAISYTQKGLKNLKYPTDGLVIAYNDINYGKSLGTTGKYPLGAMAFKWKDDAVETKLLQIVWQVGRTGVLTPVAEFEPVEIEGSVVSRATLHNIDYVRELRLTPGDIIGVYKANMIIPQVAYNLDAEKHPDYDIQIPENDPLDTKIEQHVQRLVHFASRSAVNILGISDKMLRKLYSAGGVTADCSSLYECVPYCSKLFGNKVAQNVAGALEASRCAATWQVLAGLGVPNVGVSTAKVVCNAVKGNLMQLPNLSVEQLMTLPDIGKTTAEGIYTYFHNTQNQSELNKLVKIFPQIGYTHVQSTEQTHTSVKANSAITGKTFVITGSLMHFKNRDALVADIEQHGGTTASAVSAKTSYLINNDVTSTSGKNKKATELGIPVISEEDYIKMCNK